MNNLTEELRQLAEELRQLEEELHQLEEDPFPILFPLLEGELPLT